MRQLKVNEEKGHYFLVVKGNAFHEVVEWYSKYLRKLMYKVQNIANTK